MRIGLVCALVLPTLLPAQTVSIPTLNTPYTQDFDTLAREGSSSALPPGWLISESGANANVTYAAGDGASNAGDSYSFGAPGSDERALGGLQSGSLIPAFGAGFTNSTGATIASL